MYWLVLTVPPWGRFRFTVQRMCFSVEPKPRMRESLTLGSIWNELVFQPLLCFIF